MHIVCALFLYDGDNMGVVRVLCKNDGNNTHDVRALMEDLTNLTWCSHVCFIFRGKILEFLLIYSRFWIMISGA